MLLPLSDLGQIWLGPKIAFIYMSLWSDPSFPLSFQSKAKINLLEGLLNNSQLPMFLYILLRSGLEAPKYHRKGISHANNDQEQEGMESSWENTSGKCSGSNHWDAVLHIAWNSQSGPELWNSFINSPGKQSQRKDKKKRDWDWELQQSGEWETGNCRGSSPHIFAPSKFF